MELKKFTLYQPKVAISGTLYLSDCLGNDWYSSQDKFSLSTMKIVFDDDGNIVSYSKDVSALWPISMSVTEVSMSQLPSGFPGDGLWVWDGSSVIKKKATLDEKKKNARLIRDQIKDQVGKVFNPGFTIKDKPLTDLQKEELLKYCISLSRWPKKADWPNIKLPKAPKWLISLVEIPQWPIKKSK